MSKLIISSLIIVSVLVLGFAASSAFFSDQETSEANTFSSGSLDLKVSNHSYYNGQPSPNTSWENKDLASETFRFLDFGDIKPGDWGEDTISLTVEDNDAWACYDITLVSNDDNGCNEPELADDPACDTVANDLYDGELGDLVHFVVWVDDGDNVLETNETPFFNGTANDLPQSISGALADTNFNLFGTQGEPLKGAQTYHIGKAWCFGELSLEPVAEGEGVNPSVASGLTCNGANLNNASQTDTLVADISFRVEQARNNPGFLCQGDLTCSEAQVYAATSSLEWFEQGQRKNGSDVTLDRSDPTKATGSPEGIVTPPSFFSLGFGGSIILGFAGPVGNGPGADLKLHEITNGRASYPEEKATVAVSNSASGPWTVIGEASSKDADGISLLDVSNGAPSMTSFTHVKITDISNPSGFEPTADGYDLDAVEAVYGACEPNQ